jgi:hypothetical protein
VLIVQRNFAYGDLLEAWFRAAGFDAVQCAWAHPADFHCPLLNPHATNRGTGNGTDGVKGCPLLEEADILVYDPWLYLSPGSPNALLLLQAIRAWYPRQPLILAWGTAGMPDLGPDVAKAPNVYVGPEEPAEVLGLARRLLAGRQAQHSV